MQERPRASLQLSSPSGVYRYWLMLAEEMGGKMEKHSPSIDVQGFYWWLIILAQLTDPCGLTFSLQTLRRSNRCHMAQGFHQHHIASMNYPVWPKVSGKQELSQQAGYSKGLGVTYLPGARQDTNFHLKSRIWTTQTC